MAIDPYLPTPDQELGQQRPLPPAPDKDGPPLNDARFVIPYIQQFQTILNGANRQYWGFHDEALQHSWENAYRCRMDPIINPCMQVRTYPTALLPGDVEPDDPENEDELKAAKRVTKDVRSLIGFHSLRRWLLDDGLWTGVSGSQLVMNWVMVKNQLRMRPVDWLPISGDSLTFDYSGWPGIRVRGWDGSVMSEAAKKQIIATDRSMTYRLSEEERATVLIHRCNPEAADYFRPQNARSVIGSGIRGKIYWVWALKNQIWQMGLDWLRWFSRGFTVMYYEYGNDKHLAQLTEHVKAQDGSSVLFLPVPKRTQAQPYFEKPFEHIAPSSANAQFIQELITAYLDDLLRFAILHQSLTTQVGPSGFQSGAVAAAHQTTFDNVVKMDALQLDDTITRDLVRVLYKVNEPGVTPGRWVSQLDSPNVEQLMQSAQTIVSLGGQVPLKPLTEAAGIPEPKDGETLLGGLQPGTPSAVAGIPDGTPMVGADPSGLQPLQ